MLLLGVPPAVDCPCWAALSAFVHRQDSLILLLSEPINKNKTYQNILAGVGGEKKKIHVNPSKVTLINARINIDRTLPSSAMLEYEFCLQLASIVAQIYME